MTGRARERVSAVRRPTDGPTLLRTVRHTSALVDDRAAARLLAGSGLAAEDARWARAWLVCSQTAVAADTRFGVDETAHLVFDPRRVPLPKGIADPARRAAVLAALVATGVLRPAASTDGAERLRWAPEVCEIHSAASALDWTGLVAACGREPAALLALRALAEYVLPADAWTVVPRRDLVERTGYAQKQVRVALRRLAAAGLIEAEGDAGQTARYRFTPRARTPGWAQASEEAPVQRASAESAPVATAAVATVPRTDSGAEGVEVILGGVTVRMAAGASLDIGAGARAQVEVGEGGRLRLRIATA